MVLDCLIVDIFANRELSELEDFSFSSRSSSLVLSLALISAFCGMALSRGRAERSGGSFFVVCCFHRMLVCAAFPGGPCSQRVGVRSILWMLTSESDSVHSTFVGSGSGNTGVRSTFVH